MSDPTVSAADAARALTPEDLDRLGKLIAEMPMPEDGGLQSQAYYRARATLEKAAVNALPALIRAARERDRLRERLMIESANNGELAWENADLRERTGFDRLRTRDRILAEIERMAESESDEMNVRPHYADNLLAEARRRVEEGDG